MSNQYPTTLSQHNALHDKSPNRSGRTSVNQRATAPPPRDSSATT